MRRHVSRFFSFIVFDVSPLVDIFGGRVAQSPLLTEAIGRPERRSPAKPTDRCSPPAGPTTPPSSASLQATASRLTLSSNACSPPPRPSPPPPPICSCLEVN